MQVVCGVLLSLSSMIVDVDDRSTFSFSICPTKKHRTCHCALQLSWRARDTRATAPLRCRCGASGLLPRPLLLLSGYKALNKHKMKRLPPHCTCARVRFAARGYCLRNSSNDTSKGSSSNSSSSSSSSGGGGGGGGGSSSSSSNGSSPCVLMFQMGGFKFRVGERVFTANTVVSP